MKEMYFKPNYHYEGTGWTDGLKRFAEAMFHTIRSEWVPIINENIDWINKEWSDLHPEFKDVKLDEKAIEDQANYICKKMEPINKKFNEDRLWWSTFKVTCQEGTSDFMLVIKGTDSKVFCDYTPVYV